MTMFNITDGKNDISRDKPVEHIDLVIGLPDFQNTHIELERFGYGLDVTCQQSRTSMASTSSLAWLGAPCCLNSLNRLRRGG